MVVWVAASSSKITSDLNPLLIGLNRGTIPFKQWTAGLPDPWVDDHLSAGSVTLVTVSKTAAVKVISSYTVASSLKVTTADTWFEKVHIIPRAGIDFGIIITQSDEPYEIYNAFRDSSATLSSITNNATPGTETLNVTAPVVMPRQTSILDPSTTSNNGGVGLGTIVLAKIRALQDGLPIFDTTIDFAFTPPANDVSLAVAGLRVVLIPFRYEYPLREQMRFLTDIITTLSGKEQRIQPRKQPRQAFEPLYNLDGAQRRRMQALIFDWQPNTFGFPLFDEEVTLTAAVIAGATTYPVTSTDEVDFRVGGLAAVIQDDVTFDVLNITIVATNLITASSGSVNGYPIGTSVVPLRLVKSVSPVRGRREANTLQSFQFTFEVSDNDTGALVGDLTPGFWSTYDTRVLMDDCNVIDSGMTEEYQRQVFVMDGETGGVYQTTLWGRGKRTHEKGFVLRSRSDLITFRKLLLGLGGRRAAFWIPTFAEDVLPVADATIGTDTLDIESMFYVRLVDTRLPMTILRVTFTDGTQLVREIQSAATVSATVERLTLDANWPATRTVAEFERIEFYELVRFNADEFQITHERAGLATCRAPLIRVFDDN